MSKITILLADNSVDKLYHGLVIALGARALGWNVKFFVTSQAVVLFIKNRKGKGKLNLPFIARFFVRLQMKRFNIPDVDKLIEEALNQGVEFYVDEAGLRLVNAKNEDLLENVKLSGSISFLLEAKDSDVVVTL